MQAALTGTFQVNTRVDAGEKRSADDVLALMGSSISELIRSVIHKVSRGAKDYDQLRQVLREEEPARNENLAKAQEGWDFVDAFYRSMGIDPDSLPVDTRSWDEIYEEAMDEHFRERGMML